MKQEVKNEQQRDFEVPMLKIGQTPVDADCTTDNKTPQTNPKSKYTANSTATALYSFDDGSETHWTRATEGGISPIPGSEERYNFT